jgi:hypothetical protein
MTPILKNRIIHFGAPMKPGQVVSSELQDQGVELLRASPSDIQWAGSPMVFQPNFSVYKSNLPIFMAGAMTGTPIRSNSKVFPGLAYSGTILPFTRPSLVVTWPFALPVEVQEDLIRDYKLRPSMIRGKPCMIVDNYDLDTVRHLISTKCTQTSPCIEEAINIASLRTLSAVAKIATCFFKLHQYPAFKDENHVEEFSTHVTQMGYMKEMEEPVMDAGGSSRKRGNDESGPSGRKKAKLTDF